MPCLRRLVFPLVLSAGLAASGPLSAQTTAAAAQPAPFPAGDLVSDYSGTPVADPYRALEDLESPTTKAWVAAQDRYTRSQLDRLPGLPALRDRVNALDAGDSANVTALQRLRSGQLFYLKRLPGGDYTKLYTRATVGGAERLLLDPEAIKKKTGETYAINNFSVSPDGRHVAAVLAKADAELGEMHVYSVATGREATKPIAGIWGQLSATWRPDSAAFYYTRGAQALQPGGLAFGRMRIHEKRLRGGAERVLLGWARWSGPQVREKDWPFLWLPEDSRYAVLSLGEGVNSDARIYAAPARALRSAGRDVAWRRIVAEADQVEGGLVFGHWLYVRSHLGAPRYRLLRYDLDLEEPTGVEVVPEQAGVLEQFTAAADGLYYVVRSGALSALYRLPHGAEGAGAAQPIALPFEGAVSLFEGQPRQPGVLFELEGWTRERQIYVATGSTAQNDVHNTVQNTALKPAGAALGDGWASEQLSCNSHDGAQVPMSLIYRKGLVRDGSHPTILDGYGGYGIPEPAFYAPRLGAFYEQGGIYAQVDPRGGGAYGRQWYEAGRGATKANTWKDMIACAQTLVERGYTTREKLAVEGTSMGGVAAGRALTERPELFAVGLLRVGILDSLRFVEATSNGPNHELEMGSAATAEGVQQLLAMSTYHHTTAGVPYPAVLFTAGLTDQRVAPWISFKAAARMQAATSSGRPVLLRVESQGGHGITSTATQRNAELVDRLAFVLWNTGHPAFQPAPPAQ